MDLLSGINNALSTVAKDCADAALPANLKFIGDGVATATDIATGNYGKLPQDIMDFAQDASHAAASATSSRANSGEGERTTTNRRTSAGERERATTNHRGSRCQSEPATQPSAPPNTQTLVSLLTNLLALVQGGGAQAGSTAAGTPTASAPAAGTAPTASTTPGAPAAAPSTAPATPAPSTTATTPTAPAAAAPSTASAAPAASTPTTSTTSASTAATAAPSTTTAAATTGTANAFFGQSDADLMNAVRSGQIPDAVKNDPAQMQRLQQRMNDISEMNQLISQMMAAMHDMNKAVIQNIRA